MSRTGVGLVVVAWVAGAAVWLAPASATAAQAQTPTATGGACGETPERCAASVVRAYEAPIRARADEIVAGGPYVNPSGVPIPPTTVLGLELIRDMFVRQMNATADLFERLHGQGSYDQRQRLGSLSDRAAELAELKREAARASERLRAGIANYEAPIGSLEREVLDSLDREATAAYERALEAAAAEFPELMIQHDGRALHEALAGMEAGEVGSSERMAMLRIYKSFLASGSEDLRQAATEAAGHTSIDELWRYGDPAFGLLHQLVVAQGALVGSKLPSDLVGQVQDLWQSDKTLSDAETARIQIGLAVVGILLAPVSVVACAAAGVADVVISGGELYVAVKHEGAVTEAAPVVGARPGLEAEKRTERAATGLALSTVGAALDVGVLAKLGVSVADEAIETALAERAAAANTGEAATRAATHVAGGHGQMVEGFFVLPDNVAVRFHTARGEDILDDAAREIEEAAFRGVEPPASGTRRTYEGGDRVPEHVLYPADDGPMVFVYMPWSKTTVTVTSPKQLSRIVRELSERFPDQQIVLDWAACRGRAPRATVNLAPASRQRGMSDAVAAAAEANGVEPVSSDSETASPFPAGDLDKSPARTADGGDPAAGIDGEAGARVALGGPAAVEINPPGLETASRDPTRQLVLLDVPGAIEADPANGSSRPAPGGGYLVVDGDGELRVLVRSLGGLGEGAMELQVFNGTGSPVRLTGDGLVVEPVELAEEAKQRLLDELRELAGKHPVTAKIHAYCLEFLREPPSAGSIFRIAGQDLQQRFAPLRDVLTASRRLRESGLLNPDSDPTEYFHSIRQWALWAVEERLDGEGFARAYLEQTKRNVEEAGHAWSDEIEALVEGAIPNRWNDIRQILQEARAGAPDTGENE